MEKFSATDARYLKLGVNGRWEALCLKDGTLRLAYNDVPHEIGQSSNRDDLVRHFLDAGYTRRVAASHARQVHDFYHLGEEVVWITFSDGYLWWAQSARPVEFLGGTDEEMEARGSRLRHTVDGWHKESLGGNALRIAELNGALTQTAAYRMAICKVDRLDYLLRKIRDEDLPVVERARRAEHQMLKSIRELMTHLTWQDFELLVELVFAESGWRRVSSTGGLQKTVDIEMILPTTGETAFVQIKSKTNKNDLADYVEKFEARGDARMFFVYHSGTGNLDHSASNVTLLGPEAFAPMILEAGLFGWLQGRVG